METRETQVWPAHATEAFDQNVMCRKTLNEDPYNVRAEQLAMEHCKCGFNVTEELTETDMVVSSCGSLIPGTPDGGFRDSTGLLRLVQVVRVPLLPGMDADEVGDILYETVLAKIVKSQAWMKQTGTIPHDFVIFCWLPPVGAHEVCLKQSESLFWTEALMWNVQFGGWPFSLMIQVPVNPSAIFPDLFGRRNHDRKRTYWDDLSYMLAPSGIDEDSDEEFVEWRIFDEDHDDTTVQQDLPGNVHFLVALAIQYIEHRDEQSERLTAECAWVSAPGSCREDQRVPSLRQLFNFLFDPACRARESASLIIEGLPWWDAKGRVVKAVSCLGANVLAAVYKPVVACNGGMGTQCIELEWPLAISFSEELACECSLSPVMQNPYSSSGSNMDAWWRRICQRSLLNAWTLNCIELSEYLGMMHKFVLCDLTCMFRAAWHFCICVG
eukprot:TRINITY_DN74530_c0_g1_i1.p1 TRINITY_DN74530_c0_g1~~TRINITY_DN74530_c0_g1_i1.p1  ORF type:complete len:440 (-),score=68.06 TRINITY_DN74530_c0_g1_i1:97-1416(-)